MGAICFRIWWRLGSSTVLLWGDNRTAAWQESLFDGLPDLFPEICPESAELFSMIRVTEPEDLWYWNNEQTGETLCGFLRKGK